jgi:hypothetical protein
VRWLRKDLGAKLREKAGWVEKALAAVVPEAGKQGKKSRKVAKNQAGKKRKLKLGKTAKQAAKKSEEDQDVKGERKEAEWEALTDLLGKEGGALSGKKVRLVSFGQSDLTRNAPCEVLSHYTGGMMTVSLP